MSDRINTLAIMAEGALGAAISYLRENLGLEDKNLTTANEEQAEAFAAAVGLLMIHFCTFIELTFPPEIAQRLFSAAEGFTRRLVEHIRQGGDKNVLLEG